MLNDVGVLMREALLDEYDAVTDPTHRRVINHALCHVSCYQGYTPRDWWEKDRMPPIVRPIGRAWLQRCCGERVHCFTVTMQRVTVTGVVKLAGTSEVRWCGVCGERAPCSTGWERWD
jgi:hypothetical protein